MADATEPERLMVLAALLDADPGASRDAEAWVRSDGSPADASLIDSAAPGEWDLAAAVRGDAMNDADVSAIIALLRMASGSAPAGALRIALTEAFLDGDPADHAATFAYIYRHYAVSALEDDARERARALLWHLGC